MNYLQEAELKIYASYYVKLYLLQTVPEDTATGTAVVELSVTDADETIAKLDYFITGGDPDGHFLVHTSGQVSIGLYMRNIRKKAFFTAIYYQ